MKQKIEPLHSFKNLPPEIETKLRNLLQVHTFSTGEAVFLQGDSPNGIYLVISGRVKITRVTPEGYESILCLRGPGDYFCPVPLLDHGDHLGSAIAINDIALFSIERKAFFDLCQKSPELLSIVQADCLSEVRHLLNRLEGFAFRQVRDRLAIALVNEIRRQSGEDSTDKEIYMTQEELAGLIGASRESVSRNLTRMANDGILQLRRGRVIVEDWERLRQLAGGATP